MSQATILIVDDEPLNLHALVQILGTGYRVRAANTGDNALQAVETEIPDLILLDVMMPGIDGYEVLRRLREQPATRGVPVIFLTALVESGDEERCLSLGAADYIAKPIKPGVVLARVRTQLEAQPYRKKSARFLARVRTQLEAKLAREWLRNQNAALEAEVARHVAENDLTQAVSIRALAHLAETRDPETGHHLLRTQGYIEVLARRLCDHPRFASFLTPNNISLLIRSAPLHDIGKVGIPDAILLKPGPLDDDEWQIMKTHARFGSEAIERAEQDVQQVLPFLTLAKEIARWHHEKWDGSGYPDGLAGDAIPVSARLMALADVFDALTTPRVYKRATSLDEARDLIAAERGRHFDPDVTDAFLAGYEEFAAIARRYGK
jgi:putative two-component system response regulator